MKTYACIIYHISRGPTELRVYPRRFTAESVHTSVSTAASLSLPQVFSGRTFDNTRGRGPSR